MNWDTNCFAINGNFDKVLPPHLLSLSLVRRVVPEHFPNEVEFAWRQPNSGGNTYTVCESTRTTASKSSLFQDPKEWSPWSFVPLILHVFSLCRYNFSAITYQQLSHQRQAHYWPILISDWILIQVLFIKQNHLCTDDFLPPVLFIQGEQLFQFSFLLSLFLTTLILPLIIHIGTFPFVTMSLACSVIYSWTQYHVLHRVYLSST